MTLILYMPKLQAFGGKDSQSYRRMSVRTAKSNRNIAKVAKKTYYRMSEAKFFDVTQTALGMSTTWASLSLSNVGQGLGDGNARIGDEIMQRSIRLNYSIAGADATNICRVILVRFLADGNPVASQLFSDSAATVSAPLTVYHHDNRKLFNVVYDSGLIALANAAGGWLHAVRSVSKALHQHKQRFDNAATTNVKGALYLFYCSDSAAVNHPTMNIRARYRYIDP